MGITFIFKVSDSVPEKWQVKNIKEKCLFLTLLHPVNSDLLKEQKVGCCTLSKQPHSKASASFVTATEQLTCCRHIENRLYCNI